MPRNPLVKSIDTWFNDCRSAQFLREVKVSPYTRQRINRLLAAGTETAFKKAKTIAHAYLFWEKRELRRCARYLRGYDSTLVEETVGRPFFIPQAYRWRSNTFSSDWLPDTPDYVREQLTAERMKSCKRMGLA